MEGVREKLPGRFIWGWQAAKRKHIKGRTKGMVMGIRRELKNGSEMAVEEEGIMMGNVRQGRKRRRIMEVYINGDIEVRKNGTLDGK